MMSIMMIFTLTITIIFLFLKHPLSMGVSLLVQSTLISMITGFFNYNFWFSYILFLIMIGGMLVLFIYMTSIASNEMFKYSNNLMILTMFMLMTITAIYILQDQFFVTQNTLSMDMSLLNNKMMYKMSLNKYLNFPSNMMLFFMIIYLFITLIAVVKITNISYGPLRQK